MRQNIIDSGMKRSESPVQVEIFSYCLLYFSYSIMKKCVIKLSEDLPKKEKKSRLLDSFYYRITGSIFSSYLIYNSKSFNKLPCSTVKLYLSSQCYYVILSMFTQFQSVH